MTTNTRARRTSPADAATNPQSASAPDWLARLHSAKALPAQDAYAAIDGVQRELKDAKERLRTRATELEAETDEALHESVQAFNDNQAQLGRVRAELEQVERLIPVAEKMRARIVDDGHERLIRERHAQVKEVVQRGVKALERYAPLAQELAAVLKEVRSGYEAAREINNRMMHLGDKELRSWAQVSALSCELFGVANVLEQFHPFRRKAVHELVQLPSLNDVSPFWGNIYAEERETSREQVERENAAARAAAEANPPRPAGVYDGNGNRLNLGNF